MHDTTSKELTTQEQKMLVNMQWAKSNPAEAEQLVYDAVRLLSVAEEKIEEAQNKSFFKRLCGRLNGASTAQNLSAIESLHQLQQVSLQFLIYMQREQLIQAQSLVVLENNLNTLASNHQKTVSDVTRMAKRIGERLGSIDQKISNLEESHTIHRWLLELEVSDYDEDYPEHFRLLKVIQEFLILKSGDFGADDLPLLRVALKRVGLSPKKKVSLTSFVDGLIDEIEDYSFDMFENLLPSVQSGVPAEFSMENISVPAFQVLYEVAHRYKYGEEYIRSIADRVGLSFSCEMKLTLKQFLEEKGVNIDVSIETRKLAIELLNSEILAHSLYKLPQPAKLDTDTDTEAHSSDETQPLVRRSEHDVASFIAIDFSISSASLAVHENGGTTLLKSVDNCWLEPADEFKFQQAVRVLLTDFKRVAEIYRGNDILGVVVTTPSCFSTRQRLAIREVAASLGIETTRFINRATAAALAVLEADTAVICDVRGGTLDLSIIEYDYMEEEHTYEVLATSGIRYDSKTNLSLTAIELLQQSLKEADLDAYDIDELIMAGESDEAESVKNGLQDFLGKRAMKLTNSAITPLAGAASSVGRILTGDLRDMLLLDVTNHDIGVETNDGSTITMVEKHTSMPTKASTTVTTTRDNQTSMIIHVVEANSSSAPLSKSLGYFELTGIPAAPAGMPQVKITIDIGAYGKLNVSAEEMSGTQSSHTLTIDSLSKRLPSSPIELQSSNL